MSKPSVAIVYHSGDGHTKKLAESVLEGIEESEKATGTLISVDEVDSHWEVQPLSLGLPLTWGLFQLDFEPLLKRPQKDGWK